VAHDQSRTQLLDGFIFSEVGYRRVLAGIKPLMSGMTDSVSVKAMFTDIPSRRRANHRDFSRVEHHPSRSRR
jgi:hypothetical protein